MFAFLFVCIGFCSIVSQASPLNKKTLLFLDLNDPYEVDMWISVLGLSSQGCGANIDYCNSEFNAYRPIQNLRAHEDIISWLRDSNILPDGIFITGHHVAGFFGIYGELRPLDFYNYAFPQKQGRLTHDFFLKPKFVYLGGCFTTQSKFSHIETNPLTYLNRVMSHQEVPEGDLMVSAIQQIANGGMPNPWAPYFPNAALFGFDKRGPGKKSKPNIQQLISEFSAHVKTQLATQSFSTAFDQLITTTSYSFTEPAKWWSSQGRKLTQTAAAAHVPENDKVQKLVLELPADRNKNSDEILSNILMSLLKNDHTKAPWIAQLDQDSRMQLVTDIWRLIDFSRLGKDQLMTSDSPQEIINQLDKWLHDANVSKRRSAIFMLTKIVHTTYRSQLKSALLDLAYEAQRDPDAIVKEAARQLMINYIN